jgi:putative ABC transport system permease protein
VFFMTYLRRELRRRIRQAVVTALGLALGVGLVITVAAASAGVGKAQSGVLGALYGVGADVTVTGAAPRPPQPGSSRRRQGGQGNPNVNNFVMGPHGLRLCHGDGTCTSPLGKTVDTLNASYSGISASNVAAAARLPGVAAVAGWMTLSDSQITCPKNNCDTPQVNVFTVDGADTSKPALGPLSSASLVSGHSFTAADTDAAVAVVDSVYATSRNLKVGSVLTIDQIRFTVIGVVRQARASSPPDVYVPLTRIQQLPVQAGSAILGSNEVTTIYVAAASAASVPAVSREISGLLPGASVTSQSSLASEVTGSVTRAAKLANDLGRWLAILVLVAAFVVACLLTTAAVARRAAEFGTLKAIGWRTRRIIAQVLGESAVMGIAGAAVGVGLGFAGTAIISAVAPKLSATISASTGPQASSPVGAGAGPTASAPHAHTVTVLLHPSVTAGVIVLAMLLALSGGLLAGALGSWRIARLRPADALSRLG